MSALPRRGKDVPPDDNRARTNSTVTEKAKAEGTSAWAKPRDAAGTQRPPTNAPSSAPAGANGTPTKSKGGGFVPNKIFVGGVPVTCTEEQFKDFFEPYGPITKVELHALRGFGYITYETIEAVDACLEKYEEHYICKKWVEVKRSIPRELIDTYERERRERADQNAGEDAVSPKASGGGNAGSGGTTIAPAPSAPPGVSPARKTASSAGYSGACAGGAGFPALGSAGSSPPAATTAPTTAPPGAAPGRKPSTDSGRKLSASSNASFSGAAGGGFPALPGGGGGGGGGWGAAGSKEPPGSRSRIKQLTEMGFSEDVAKRVLSECVWDVNKAIDRLLSSEIPLDTSDDPTPGGGGAASNTPIAEVPGSPASLKPFPEPAGGGGQDLSPGLGDATPDRGVSEEPSPSVARGAWGKAPSPVTGALAGSAWGNPLPGMSARSPKAASKAQEPEQRPSPSHGDRKEKASSNGYGGDGFPAIGTPKMSGKAEDDGSPSPSFAAVARSPPARIAVPPPVPEEDTLDMGAAAPGIDTAVEASFTSVAAAGGAEDIVPQVAGDAPATGDRAPPKKRIEKATRPWAAEDASQLSVVEEEYVNVWVDTGTDHGWIHAERRGGDGESGWLPRCVLQTYEVGKRWMCATQEWKAQDGSQCSIQDGAVALIWASTRTPEGWTYAEVKNPDGTMHPGWLPVFCLDWYED